VTDRGFVAACAAVAGFLGTDPPVVGQAIAYVVLLALVACFPVVGQPKGSQQEAGVAFMLSEFRAAGFTDQRAKDLAQEAIRATVRKEGGWQP
jgi:hypothetical protein